MTVLPVITHHEVRRDRSALFAPSKETRIKSRMLGDDALLRWYHVCSVEDQTANGHPVTRRFLELFVEDFYSRPEPGPVYRGHVDAEGTPTGEEPPAAAWVLALELTDDGRLFALYELTVRLAGEIKEGCYRFNSIYGAVRVDDDGNETDAEFISIAVTNKPAVSNLLPMAASRSVRLFKETSMSDAELIKAALKELGDKATLDSVMKWVAAKKQLDAVTSGESGDAPAEGEAAPMSSKPDPEAKPVERSEGEPEGEPVKREEPTPDAAREAAMAESFALLEAAATEAGTDVASVIAMLRDRMADFVAFLGGTPASGTPSDTADAALARKLSLQSSTIKELSRRVETAEGTVAELRKEKADREAKLAKEKAGGDVDALIKAGRLLETQKEKWIKTALSDRKLFDELVTDLPQVVPTARFAADDGPTGDEDSDELLKARDDTERQILSIKASEKAKKAAIRNHRRRTNAN